MNERHASSEWHTRTEWHASEDQVIRYADGSLPEPDAWSLEKHLESCGACAHRVSRAVRGTAAGAALAAVREAVLAEARGLAPAREARGLTPAHEARRLAPAPDAESAPAAATASVRESAGARGPAGARGSALTGAQGLAPAHEARGLPAPDAESAPAAATAPTRAWASMRARASTLLGLRARPVRALWAMGPAVRGAWLPAVLLVAVGAVALARGGALPDARPWLLALAPLVPVAGVALSYGPHADPMHEIVASTPSAGLRLVLMRTAAVLTVSLPLLTLAGVLLPSSDAPGAAAWLLPGLALTLASLALACRLGLRTATSLTGGGWLSAVLGPVLAAPGGRLTAQLSERLTSVLDGAAAQGAWAGAAVLCAAVLAVHRPSFPRLEKS